MILDTAAEVARRQAARLSRKVAAGSTPRGHPSPWAHVPLRTLFEEAGNAVFDAGGGELETGHRPFHTSRSGRCLRLNPKLGLWFCRGCNAGGDALTYWMARHGLSRHKAAEQLAARYGAPKTTRRRRRRSYVREVPL